MQVASSVDIATAVASGLAAGGGVWLLVSSARRRTGLRRQAHYLLAVGAALTTISTIGGLGVLMFADGWGRHQPRWLDPVDLVSVGLALGGLLLCVGLLRLPGAAGSGAAALRLILDGLVIAAALWFVGFVSLSEPTRVLGDATPAAEPVLLVVAGAAVAAIGLTVAVALRSGYPRRGLCVVGCGVGLTGIGGLGLATGIFQAGRPLALVGAVVVAGGLVLLALASRATDESGAQDFDVIRRGTGYAFGPMLAMALAGIYHLLVDGGFLALGVGAWIVEGFALVTRQYLALLDVRGIADRLAEREAHFRDLAHTDPLTGLANRRGLLSALPKDGTGAACVLLCLDLDGFKNVNDMRGHDVGDEILQEVGRRLGTDVRPGDLAARVGGDAFAVLMWTRPPEAQRAAHRLLKVLSDPYPHPKGPVSLSVSIGLAGLPDTGDSEGLLRNADLALRFAKQRGKNRVEEYDLAYDRRLRRRGTLEHDLRDAAERGELRLAFQPVVAMPSVRPVGAEALLRWRHPALGDVRPDEFIPLAEECGMIAKLGGWVLREACRQLSLWLAAGHDVWVSVNASPRELHEPEYVARVAEALRAYRVPPQRLVLEVTEHAVATDLDELIRRLRALRATGVRIALDDFGAGYSSLGQLRNLPIDILKIDHSLVTEPESAPPAEGRAAVSMVDVVMRLGHRLGLEVIAEGVTNQSELATVIEAGCRFGQGQLFGWGVPGEHLEAMLTAATSPGARSTPAGLAGPQRLALPVPDEKSPTETSPARAVETSPDQRVQASSAQSMGSVDSSHEMRQA